ncbi:MAG: cupin domain-containing protein [Chitinophagaceae bacterium]|nr:cupin domain-containing protein [Chitinophagaceae bacterium]
MKRLLSITILFVLIIISVVPVKIYAQHESTDTKHIFANARSLKWQKGPASLPAGAKLAVLEGDMTKAEPFTVRLLFPANYKVHPHWHPAIEHVTVIQGALYMGTGESFNMATAKKLSAGDFATMPIRYAHYAFTKGKTIIQLHGVGPWGITYINAADDPRNK